MNFNRKASVYIYALMLSLTIIVLALALAPVTSEFITSAMNETTAETIGLNCSSTEISKFDKGACVVTDFSLFYFIAGLILIAFAIMGAKILF